MKEYKKEIITVNHKTKEEKKEWVIFRLSDSEFNSIPENERKTFIPVNEEKKEFSKPKKAKEFDNVNSD
jgi:hypothetical protein